MSLTTLRTDPITTEIIRNGFISAAEEMNLNLARSAYTPIIYEMKDCSVALFNERIELLGQAPGLPIFLGALDAAIQVIVDHFGVENLRDGDIYVINDPYLTGSHLNDVTIISPVFHDAALVGYTATKAHWIDIGAMDPGGSFRATEIYQEGYRIGPTRLVEAGVIREDLVDIFARNSRLPRSIRGDMLAQVAACRTGERRYQAILDKFGRATVESATQAIFEQCEQLDREAVAAIPDGVYQAEGVMDNDGQTDEPVPVKVKVTVSGTDLVLDLTGSSRQRRACLNCGFPQTVSAARLAFKFLINPRVPATGGTFRPLRVIAEPGSIFAAREPAPVQQYYPHAGLMIDLFIRALAPAMPDLVAANQCADPMNVLITGIDPRSGEPFISAEATGVGWGGHARGDGESALVNYGGGDLKNFPAEVMEHRYPLKILRYALDGDSAGAGRSRGGLGLVREYEIRADEAFLTLWFERSLTPGLGLFGGATGRPPRVSINPGQPDEVQRLKVNHLQVNRGTRLRVITGGGGGFGPPADRDPSQVQSDLADGYISSEAARRDYGIEERSAP